LGNVFPGKNGLPWLLQIRITSLLIPSRPRTLSEKNSSATTF